MCGRTSVFQPQPEIERRFDAHFTEEWVPQYNIAPEDDLPAIQNESPDAINQLEWGLIPEWADDPDDGPRPINARAETVAEKPMFRSAFVSVMSAEEGVTARAMMTMRRMNAMLEIQPTHRDAGTILLYVSSAAAVCQIFPHTLGPRGPENSLWILSQRPGSMPSREAWRWVVLQILEPEKALSWQEAFDWVDEEVADELEEVIAELQEVGRVQMSLREGGYMLADESTQPD